jgi:hypothetical protein
MIISFFKKNNYLFFILVSFLFFIAGVARAQTATGSPYTRYGLGEINNRNVAQGFAMGGAVIALQNDTLPLYHINASNPASYSSIKLTTAELGVNYSRMKLINTSGSQTINNASLAYISFGLPMKKWWGLSAGLIPFSSVGYKVSDQKVLDNIGTVDFLYDGSGGVNQLYLGNGIKPFYGLTKMFVNSAKYQRLKQEKNSHAIQKIINRRNQWKEFSVGLNVSYLFGNIANTRRSIFPGSANAFNTRSGTTTRFSDVYLDYGIQHSFNIDSIRGRDLKENVRILVGATFSAQTNIHATIDSLSVSYFNNSSGYEIVKDTITFNKGTSGNVTLPLSFGFGLGFRKGERWLLTSDFAMQNWSSFQKFNQAGGLRNSTRVALGAQYIPNPRAVGIENYKKRINYRLGAHYSQTYLELKSSQLVEYAISAGVGLPVGRSFAFQNFSMVNLSVEFGTRGTISNGLVKENYFKAMIGFTINDKWFIKTKFD